MTRRAPISAVIVLAVQAGFATAQTTDRPSPQPVFEIAPRGYVQLDTRTYPDWPVATGTGRLTHDTFELRRARVGVDGRLWRISYELTVDPQDEDGVFVKDAYGEIRVNDAVRLRAGQFKLPGTLEYQTSARTLDVMERSGLAESLAAGRDIGAMVIGQAGQRFEFTAGLFAGDGNGRGGRADATAAGRVTWTPVGGLDLAATFSEGRTSAVDTDPENGLDGRAPSGYRFFDRLYVQGRRSRIGTDMEWNPGRWRVIAQALWAREARDEQGLDFEDLPALMGVGWSAEVTRHFGRRPGPPARLQEWDVTVRYDQLSFDDVGPETEADSVRPRATDVRARAARTLTAAASWRLTNWARAIGDVSVERYSEPRSAPEAGRESPYWVFGTRLQFQLP